MIRAVSCSLKFANNGKKQKIKNFLDEYKRLVETFSERIWELEKLPHFRPSYEIDSWFTARAKSAAAQQATGIVKGIRKKHDARKFTINKLMEEKDFIGAERVKEIQNKWSISAPKIKSINAILDSRFVKIKISKDKGFDIWTTLFLKRGEKINVPFKITKTFKKWFGVGRLCSSICLNESQITFFFECEPKKSQGQTVGIDIGLKKTFSTSLGIQTQADAHGHTLQTICSKLSRKKKGSKAFERSQEHRKNYIRWSVNQLNLSNVSEIRIENIKNLRKGRATSALLSRWNYADIFEALELKCEELGVQVTRVQNAYTSRRCHACGWTEENNRSGELFNCCKCGHSANADINAAKNINLNLSIERRPNLNQFYWLEQERIVPAAKK